MKLLEIFLKIKLNFILSTGSIAVHLYFPPGFSVFISFKHYLPPSTPQTAAIMDELDRTQMLLWLTLDILNTLSSHLLAVLSGFVTCCVCVFFLMPLTFGGLGFCFGSRNTCMLFTCSCTLSMLLPAEYPCHI